MTGIGSRSMLFAMSIAVCFLALKCAPESPLNPASQATDLAKDSLLVKLRFAENFSVYRSGNDTIIQVTDGTQVWKSIVSKAADEGSIQIPLKDLSCLSTSHLYYFSEIGGLDKVKAVSFAESLQDEEVKAAVKNGSLLNLTSGSSDYDAELVLELQPSVFTTYPFGDDEFERLQRAGIQTLHFTEYLEKNPLGRAEWVKLAGFLLGEEKKAEAYFSQIKESYMLIKLKALTKKSERPSVVNANGYANKWTAPSGNSLVAHFVKDAGGRYVFENDISSGNLNLDFERVYELANSSDYWACVIFSDSVTLETFVGEEQRLNDTKVIKAGSIFYCNAQEKDYFGKGILQPHLILEDLYQIFYPDSSIYEAHYFEQFKK
ncbi:MAG: ABC transporter substrate-binding protein [Flavobacteriales bacterium]